MYYSPDTLFRNTLVNIYESIALTKTNQLTNFKGEKRCWCGSTEHLCIAFKDSPMEISIQKDIILFLEMGISKSYVSMSGEVSAVEEE